MSEIFIKGLREKVRFQTGRGVLSIEDVWQLPVEDASSRDLPRVDLVTIHAGLCVEKNLRAGSESLLKKKSRDDETLLLKIAIIEHIADVKQAEQKAREEEAANKSTLQKLMGFLEEEQDESLRALPKEEKLKRIKELSK